MEEMNQMIRKKNRMALLLIAGIPVTVILVATWLWYFVVRGDLDLVGMLGTANRGTLVQPPRQLDDNDLLDERGSGFKYVDLDPKWAMLVPAANARCDELCETSLYLTRQIRVAMGQDSIRLRRLFISESRVQDTAWMVRELSDQRPAPADFADYLAREHRGVKALILGPGSSSTLFAEYAEDPSTWYLVDPRGWIMMSYNSETTYKEVISDLKFLLKNSSE